MYVKTIGISLLAATPAFAAVSFSTDFECGNGTAFTEVAPDTWEWRLENDTNSGDKQWYYFETRGAAGKTLTFRLLGASKTNVPSHWTTAVPVYSTDNGETFSRVEGEAAFTSPTYTFTHTFTSDSERLAMHYPYSYSTAIRKFAEWEQHPDVSRSTVGKSVEGRDIVHFLVTDADYTPPTGKAGIWIIARQHSAEVTGSFVMEGFFDYLLSDEPEALALRQSVVFNIVPFMNPDGATAGNYRDNAKGVNLNRVWDGTANMEKSPEVASVEPLIDKWVADGHDYRMFLDLHSTAQPTPHFAFHANRSITTPDHYAELSKFIRLVDKYAPQFDPKTGLTGSNERRLAYHDQRQAYGVLAATFEAGYGNQEDGPTPEAPMTPETHREVGVAIAKAIVELYGFTEQPEVSSHK